MWGEFKGSERVKMTDQERASALGVYRILDLTEGGCMIGGRMLGDLGADVIKIERPGGSTSRIAPFYKDIPDPEKSLYWFAYNLNKRGVTLDISKNDGRELFRKLVKTADAIIESFEPGYMSSLALGYEDLVKLKQDIIVTSITPFGQKGPKAHYTGSDLTVWASGGYLYICGDPDRPPNWMSFPQALLHGGAEGASGTMTALWHRNVTGEGQHVDVSMQECVVACCFNSPEMWDLNQIEFTRFSQAVHIGTQKVHSNVVWKCKDGYVILIAHGGVEPFVTSMKGLVKWMAEEGRAEDWLTNMDWAKGHDASKLTQAAVDRVEDAIAKFLMTKTKMELYEEGALKRRILTGPLATSRDLWEDAQLRSRDFWRSVQHPELNEVLVYPGPFLRMSDTQMRYRRCPPHIGEHNSEIYEKELGYSGGELTILKQAGVI
jgi:crotonobetainyl-CoA:carnitine CoA-transferase CaiB-like acyl-CoA transferase